MQVIDQKDKNIIQEDHGCAILIGHILQVFPAVLQHFKAFYLCLCLRACVRACVCACSEVG